MYVVLVRLKGDDRAVTIAIRSLTPCGLTRLPFLGSMNYIILEMYAEARGWMNGSSRLFGLSFLSDMIVSLVRIW